MNVYTEKQELEDNLQTIKYQCSFLENWSIFSYKIIEDRIDDNFFNTTIIDDPNNYLYFSFCNDSNITCSNVGNDRGSALIRDVRDQKCIRVTSDNWNDVSVEYVDNELDTDRDYLRLSWTGADKCDFSTKQDELWQFTIDVVCSDVAIEDSRFFYTGGFDETCHVKSQFESKLGCAIVSYNQVWRFLDSNRVIFAIVLIVVGFFLAIAGYRIFIVSLFLAGLLATVAAVMVLAYQFILSKGSKQYVFWIILAVSIVLGALVGYAVARFRKVGVFLLACWGGACLGLLLNNAVMRYAESQALFWVVIAGCGLALGIIS